MEVTRHDRSRSFPSSPPRVVVSHHDSLFGFLLSSFLQLSFKRRIVVVSTFLVGLVLTIIMKREQLLWLLTTAAGAAPILEWGQGSDFDYPGLRFGLDRQFNITIFEDLHFGEGKKDFYPSFRCPL